MAVTRLAARLIEGLWKIETRRCAQCWSAMRLVKDGRGNGVLMCPNQCEPGGHVSDIYVRYERMRDADRAREAARTYPWLAEMDGFELPTPEQAAASINALFGDGTITREHMARWAEAHGASLPPGYWEVTYDSEDYRDERLKHQLTGWLFE